MRIAGTIEDGSGRCSQIARLLPADAWKPLGYVPYPGSLNVRVAPSARALVMRLPAVEVAGERYWPVRVFGEPAHVKVSRDRGTLEIVHPRRLRDRPGVCNGRSVVVSTLETKHMRLSAAVMAHPVRREGAERVQQALGRDVPIIYDANPAPSADPEQRWKTGRRAWQAHDPDADWHMVIQDDAIVCEDLMDGLEAALDVLGPDGLMSAYTGTGRPQHMHIRRALRHAIDKGHSWMPLRSLCWGVAIIAPVATISDMLSWCDSRVGMNYDMRIGRYYRDVLEWRTWYTVPSLVDHEDGPSLVGHGGTRRTAHMMHTGSALDIDWTRTPPNGLDPSWRPR